MIPRRPTPKPGSRGRRRSRLPALLLALVLAGAVGLWVAAPAQAAPTELPPTAHNGELPPPGPPASAPSPASGQGSGSTSPPGTVCGTSCANVDPGGSSGNLAVCAQRYGSAATLATDLMNRQYQAPEQAALACIRGDTRNLDASERSKLVADVMAAEGRANQGPAAYQQFVDLVTWAITGMTAGGPSWFIGEQPDTDGNPPTMAELYTDQDYGVNVPQDITGLFGVNGNEIPAFGFPPAVNTGQAVVQVGDFSFSGTWMTAGSNSIGNAVKDVYRKIFKIYLAAVILLSVVFMFVSRGHHERGLVHLVSEAGWMIVGIVLVIFFALAPGQLLQNANGLSTGIAQQVLAAGVGASPTLSGTSNVYEPNPPPAGSLSSEAPALKVYDQAWWQQNVYDPWTLINFGTVNPTSTDGKRDLGTEVLADEQITGGNNEFSSSADLKAESAQLQAFYTGSNPGLRVGYLALTYLNLIIAELLMVVIEIGLVIAYIGLLMAWLAIAVMGLLVVVPGKGREIAWGLCQLVIGLLTLRIIYAGLLALVMIITEVVIPAIVGGQSWGAQFVFGGAVFATIFFMRRRLLAPIAMVIHGHSVEAESGGGRAREKVRSAAESAWRGVAGARAAETAGAAGAAEGTAAAGTAAGAGAGGAAAAGAGGGGAFAGFAAAAAPVAAVALPFVAAGAITYGIGSAGFGDVKTIAGRGQRHRHREREREGREYPSEELAARRVEARMVARSQQAPAADRAAAATTLPPPGADQRPPEWMRLKDDDREIVDVPWRDVTNEPPSTPAKPHAPTVAAELPPMKQ